MKQPQLARHLPRARPPRARLPRRRLLRGVMLILVAAIVAPAAARACNPVSRDFPGTVQVYEGRIGAYPVRVGLQFGPGGEVVGRYGYAGSVGTIPLDGRLAGSALTLAEHGGPAGAVSGHFAGRMRMIAGDCGFTGTWRSASRGKPLGVRLRASDSSFRKIAYYTSPTALRIEHAAVALRAAILAGRRAEVVAAVRYPVFVSLGGKRTRLASAAALLAHYDEIFTPAFIAGIRATIPHMMFVRDQGTMLGDGQLWFDDAGQAIAINN